MIIWGLRLAFDDSFSVQFGIGIALIGLFVILLFLAFCEWHGHDWHLTKFTFSMLISASVVAFIYCYAVLFLPDYFTYNGTTAIFMAVNYIAASIFVYIS